MPCWKKSNPRKDKNKQPKEKDDKTTDETGALVLIGGISSVKSISDFESSGISSHRRDEIVLDHHIFNSQDGWKKSRNRKREEEIILLIGRPAGRQAGCG